MKRPGRVLGALAIAASAAMAGCEHTNATQGSTTPTSNSDVDLIAWEGTAEYPNGQTTVSGYAILDSSYAQLKLTSTNPVKGEIRYFHGTSSDGDAHSKHGYDAQPTPYCTGTWTETQRLPNSETTGAEERIVHEHITSGNCQDSDWHVQAAKPCRSGCPDDPWEAISATSTQNSKVHVGFSDHLDKSKVW